MGTLPEKSSRATLFGSFHLPSSVKAAWNAGGFGITLGEARA
jgi:hypothetical protein